MPSEKYKTAGVSLDNELLQKIDYLRARTDHSRSSFIRWIVREALENYTVDELKKKQWGKGKSK